MLTLVNNWRDRSLENGHRSVFNEACLCLPEKLISEVFKLWQNSRLGDNKQSALNAQDSQAAGDDLQSSSLSCCAV